MTSTTNADICVIGAGAGGLSVAAGAAQLGRKVVLVEKGAMGGDCLNYGCVPSKALIAAAAKAHSLTSDPTLGIYLDGQTRIDFKGVMAHVRRAIDTIAPHDSQERFEKLGVTVIHAPARFTGPRKIEAGGQTIKAKFFALATGTSPFIPPIPGLADTPYLTNETIFSLTTLPNQLLVLGGGPIGVELGQAFTRLGSDVTIIDRGTILSREDPKMVDQLRKALSADGTQLCEHASLAQIDYQAGEFCLSLNNGNNLTGSHLLVATGRRAELAPLNLAAADINEEKGRLVVDDRLRTTNKRVFAVGDIAGGPQFTHLAGDHASTVIRNILFKIPAKRRDALTPRVTYSAPAIATIGLTQKQAEAQHRAIDIVTLNLGELDRAITDKTNGTLKLILSKKGKILGASLIAANAADILQPMIAAYQQNKKASSLLSIMVPYPNLSEANKRTVSNWIAPKLFAPLPRFFVRLLTMFD